MERANGVRGRLRVGGGRGGWYFIERVRKRKREGNSWGVCEEKERERDRERQRQRQNTVVNYLLVICTGCAL